MQYRDYQPHTALQSHIASYFSLEVDEAKQERELVLPDGTHGLIFVQNAGFVRESSEGNAQKITGSYLFGQKTSAVYYSLDVPGLSCFGVKFQPTGIRALVGAHASELTDHVVEAWLDQIRRSLLFWIRIFCRTCGTKMIRQSSQMQYLPKFTCRQEALILQSLVQSLTCHTSESNACFKNT